jgi:ribosomal protein L28
LTIKQICVKVNKQVNLYVKEDSLMAINISGRKPNLRKRIRSHALNTTNSTQGLNLQVVRLEDGTRVRISAKEARTLRKAEKVDA